MFAAASKKQNELARVASSSLRPRATLRNDNHPLAVETAATLISQTVEIDRRIEIAEQNLAGCQPNTVRWHALNRIRKELKRMKRRAHKMTWPIVFALVAHDVLPTEIYEQIEAQTRAIINSKMHQLGDA